MNLKTYHNCHPLSRHEIDMKPIEYAQIKFRKTTHKKIRHADAWQVSDSVEMSERWHQCVTATVVLRHIGRRPSYKCHWLLYSYLGRRSQVSTVFTLIDKRP